MVSVLLIVSSMAIAPFAVSAISNAQVIHDGFETANAIGDTNFWTPISNVSFVTGASAITPTKSLRLIDGTNSAWQTVFGAKDSNILASNTTYTISFKYKMNTTGNQLQFAITETNTWGVTHYGRFDADTATATNGAGLTYSKYNASNYNYVQFKFTTAVANGKSSYFTLQRANDATALDITIDDFSIYTGDAPSWDVPGNAAVLLNSENFENGTGLYSRTKSWIDTDKPFVMNRGFLSANVLNGSASIYGGITTLATNWDEMMQIPSSSLAIDVSTTYTIKFRYKILENTKNFFYVMFTNSSNSDSVYFGFNQDGAVTSFMSNVVGYSITDEGNGVKLATVSLLTKGTGAYTKTNFGYEGGGKIAFDDIAIFKGMNADSLSAIQVNLSNPALEAGANFEDATDSKYFWTQTGTNYTAQVSTDATSLISGSSSFAIRSTAAWSEELIYDFMAKPLDANTRYTVSFKYKPFTDAAYPYSTSSRFYFIVNSPSLGAGSNKYQAFTADGNAVYLLNSAPWYNGIEDFVITPNASGYFDANVTFTTQDASDVRFMFGVANGGAYSLDDIKVSKGLGVSSQAILNNSKYLSSFNFNSLSPAVIGAFSTLNISATVPAGTNLTNLVATFVTSPTSTVTVNGVPQVSGVTANDFTNPVVYRDTAEDGSFLDYTVTVTKIALDSSKVLSAFSLDSLSPPVIGAFSETNISATVLAGTDLTALVATFTASAKATVTVNGVLQVSGVTANDFTNPIVYRITAEDGSFVDYIVTITKEIACTIDVYLVSSDGTNIITGVAPNSNVVTFMQNIHLSTNVTYTVINATNDPVGEGLVGTGTKLNVYNPDLTLYKTYTVVIYGDVNLNGTVTAADALMALQIASGKITATEYTSIAADVNNSATITAADALKILQYASGKITSF